jgi:hypothetical protein
VQSLSAQMSQVLGLINALLTILTGDSSKNISLKPASVKLLTAIQKQINAFKPALNSSQPGTSKKLKKSRSQNSDSTRATVEIVNGETPPTVSPPSSLNLTTNESNESFETDMQISDT